MGNLFSFYEQPSDVKSCKTVQFASEIIPVAVTNNYNNLQITSNDSIANYQHHLDVNSNDCEVKSFTPNNSENCCSSPPINLNNNLECHEMQTEQYSTFTKVATTVAAASSSLNFVTTSVDMTHKKNIMSQVHLAQDQCVEENSTLAPLADAIDTTIQRVTTNGQMTKNNNKLECSQLGIASPTTTTMSTIIATAADTITASTNTITIESTLFSDKNMNVANFNEQPVTSAVAPPLLSVISMRNIMRTKYDEEEHNSDHTINDACDLNELCHHSAVIDHRRPDVRDTFTLAVEFESTTSKINCERNSPAHPTDLTVISYKLNDVNVNVRSSDGPKKYKSNCVDDIGDVDKLSLINKCNVNVHQQLHKPLQNPKNKGNRSLTAKNIIQSDGHVSECNCICKRSVSDSELNKIYVIAREIDLINKNEIEFITDIQGTNEMKLDMKSSGKGVTLPNSVRSSNEKRETFAPISKSILNNPRIVTLKNFRNSAIDKPRYDSTSLPLNNVRNVDSNHTSSNSRSMNLNRPSSNIYNVDAKRTPLKAANVDSKRPLSNAFDLNSNRILRNKPNENPNSTLKNLNRTLSIDTALDTVVPERIRLKRQRRFCSQDEPDDPIERLNRLKARISGALSEVKGVLKQYSVDSEDIECPGENDATNKTIENVKDAEAPEIQPRRATPFRFVKKIYSRSSFAEEDDEDEDKVMPKSFQDLDASKIKVERKSKLNKTNEQLNNLKDRTMAIHKINLLNSVQSDSPRKDNTESAAPKQLDSTLKMKRNQKNVDPSDTTSEVKGNLKNNLSEIKTEGESSGVITQFSKNETSLKVNENDKLTKNNCEISENKKPADATMKVPTIEVSSQSSTPNGKEKIIKEKSESTLKGISCTVKETGAKSYENKPEASVKDKILNKEKVVAISETAKVENIKKTTKKVTSKNKEPDRRASVSCVDSSKLTTLTVPGQIKRRPSDSEAILKKKINNTIKSTTSGTLEDVTSQVKNSTVKKANAPVVQEADKKSEITMKHVNNSNVNESVVNVKASRALNGHSNDILIPTKATIQSNIKNNVELMPKQIPINETFNDRSSIVIKEPPLATTTTVKATNQTLNKGTSQVAIDLQENDTEIKKCSTKTDVATRERKINNHQEMSSNLLDGRNAIIEKSEKKFNDRIESGINENEKQESKPLQIISNSVKTECQSEQLNVDKSKQKPNDDEQVRIIAAIKVDDIANDKAIKTKLNSTIDQTHTNATTLISKLHSGITNGYSTNGNHIITNIPYGPPSVISSCEENKQQDTATDKYQTEIILKPSQSPETTITATTNTNQNTTLSIDQLSSDNQLLVNSHDKEMPEQQIAPVPIQTTEILSDDTNAHKQKVSGEGSLTPTICEKDEHTIQNNKLGLLDSENAEIIAVPEQDMVAEVAPEAPSPEPMKPKKERKVKKKVIIKRQRRRLSVNDASFFQNRSIDESPTTPVSFDTETLEKPIAFVTDDEDDKSSHEIPEIVKKPLKSCIKVKEYEIGDEVLYPERFKKTQVRWKRGKIKERITSISYLIDIDGKEVSSHVNYLKKYTNRKVKFSGKEYLEIDYEQLAEEEEKAEVLRKRAQSIWNMV